MRTVAATLLLLLAASAPASAAGQDPPGASSVRRVRGQVRADDDSAAQLRRVRVAVVGETATPTFTDQEGRFEIAIPASGAFTLRFSKAGFAPQQIASTRLPADGGIQVRLARGAAIAGRAVDETGAPLIDLPVRVRSVGEVAHGLPVSIGVRTDDLGEFRVGSLPAGRYEAGVEDLSPRITVNDAGGVTISSRPAPAPGPAAVVPAAPPPPVPETVILRCDSDAMSCRDLLARGGPVRAEPVAVPVQLRTGEDGGVTIVHGGNAAAVRGAVAYSAGFAAGAQAGVEAGTARSRASGTAVITGVVTSADGRPVPWAQLLLRPETPGGPFGSAAAGAAGVFEFAGLAAGSYRVAATMTGFMIGEYGQVRAGDPGTVVTVRDGQRVERVDITLQRGAVIAGAVTDPDGEPLEGLTVQVWRATASGGRPAAEVVAGAPTPTTDDRGRYRIHGLQPGAYYVVASEAGSAPEGSGRTNGVRAAPRAFYPAAPTLAQANVVRVDAGVDATGADITFLPAPTFRVSGIALDSDGDPITWPVALTVSAGSGGVMMPPLTSPFAFDGSFEFPHVPPGRYVLQAFQMATREFGRAFVDVIDGDVGPVRLNVAPTSTLSGRIVVNGAPADALGDVRIDVLAADPDYFSQNALPRAAVFMLNTRSDSGGSTEATYEMRGLAGPVRFVDARAPAGWWLESVNIGGVNAADEPVLFEAPVDSRSDVDIVFSTNGAAVSGRALDGRNEPAAAYVAVAFPVDRQRWYTGSRYVKSAQPVERARFTIPSLPPGDYWLAAVEALPDGALRDPGVLDALTAVGRRVTLAAGERLAVDLPLVRLPAAAR